MKRTISILFASLVLLVAVLGTVQAMTQETIGYCYAMCYDSNPPYNCLLYPPHVCYCPTLELTNCYDYCRGWCD